MKRSTVAILMGMIISVTGLGASGALAATPPAPSDKVSVEWVTFNNRILIDVAGDLYMPKNIDTSKKYRAIAVGHPFGGVADLRRSCPEAGLTRLYRPGL